MKISTNINRRGNSSKRKASLGNFEEMEDRKLFAADVMGAAEMATELVDRPDSESQAVISKFDGIEDSRLELESSRTLPGGEIKPAPDDDSPPGQIGPVYKLAEMLGDAGDAVVAEQLAPSAGVDHGKPAPDDDDPPGPIGPVYKNVVDLVMSANVLDGVDQVGGLASTIALDLPGESEGKPDEIDCDGNPLTASCDLAAEVPVEQAKPDDLIDCDGNPLTAGCDLTALPEFEHVAPHPGDANGDFRTDFNDFLILSSNYGTGDATLADGDFNGNGTVDFNDFLIQSKYFGTAKAHDLVFAL